MYTNDMKQKPGFSLTEFLIIGAIVALLAVAGTLMIGIERSRNRDAKRIADMTNFAAGFAILYAQDASYAAAAEGCATVGVLATTCKLPTLTGMESQLKDPGSYSYQVTKVPDAEDFGISFRLERPYAQYAAGTHLLTRSGIK